MKTIQSIYTFSAASKTVTCNAFALYGLARILMIVNVSRGVVIYNPGNTATNGSLSGSTLTLTFNTAAHNDADVLQIFVDDADTGSTEQTLSQLAQCMTEFVERMDVYTDGAGRLQVAITNAAAQGALSSVGTVTTVTNLTNLLNIGAGAVPGNELWRFLMETPNQMQNSLFPVT